MRRGIKFIKVVFPEPVAPTKAINSEKLALKLIFFKINLLELGYLKSTFLNSIVFIFFNILVLF